MRLSGTLNQQPAPFRVRLANFDNEVEALTGETLLACARRAGVSLGSACGGHGVCASCVVRLLSGRVDPSPEQGNNAYGPGPAGEWLRACLVRPASDCVVEVAPRALAAVVRNEVGCRDLQAVLPFAPTIRVVEVTIPMPGSEIGGGDQERLLAALSGEGVERVDLEMLKRLPQELRKNGWQLRVVVRDRELIGFIPVGGRALGLAIDLGTTNIAASVTDLESGDCLAISGRENPQATFGADLISRINHAVRTGDGALELHAVAVSAITLLAAELCDAAGAHPEEIVDIALCGNSAMHHLLLELPVSQLGRAPFVPAACAALDVKARDLGLALLPGAWLHVMPNIGGFVGGDHVATLLATEHRWSDGTSLVIDIGTNTEISLIHDGAITTASTASGPALEGGNISCGMRAAMGAVERVWLDRDGIRFRTIGEAPPVGLCGSGVVDALAVLRRAGVIDGRGYMRPDHPGVHESGGSRAFPLAPGVSFTQEDVRAVQLAKAAIRAGIDLLLREAGLGEDAIDRVVVAGAFGIYLDLPSAVDVGLLPPLPPERFEQVGNAAGIGVRMALASGDVRRHAQELAARCRHIELNRLPDFQKVFLARIGL